jgi:regulator of protease activity HflC (stomatin/prohibitin superfamily)
MNEFIVKNLQVLLMALALFASMGYAFTGISRYDDDDGERSTRYEWKKMKRAGVLLVIGVTLAAAFPVVPAGHRGVVFGLNQGVMQEELDEGLNTVIPYWQRVHNMNVRIQLFEYESFVQTKDLQEVTLPIAINYHVIPSASPAVFQRVGFDYERIILDPAAFQASTQAAGRILAEDIAFSRAKLAFDIQTIMSNKLFPQGIVIQRVAIKDAVFDKDFIAAIKAKVIATQKAEESLRLVEVAKNEADQVRAEASGNADALVFMGQGEGSAIIFVAEALGFSPEEYLLWLRLGVWDGQLPDTVLSEGSDVIVDLP